MAGVKNVGDVGGWVVEVRVVDETFFDQIMERGDVFVVDGFVGLGCVFEFVDLALHQELFDALIALTMVRKEVFRLEVEITPNGECDG